MKHLIVIIACFVAFSMNSQVDRVLVNGNEIHTTLNLLELESIIETLQAQVAALQTAQSSSFDGDYNSLTNQPAIPSNVSDLTNDAGYTTFDGAYGNLTGAPTLATVATSGSYTDLSNQLSQKDIVQSAYNLASADLSNANLIDANLTDANLSYANLSGADLTGANLTGVTWTGAYIDGCTGCFCPTGGGAYCD